MEKNTVEGVAGDDTGGVVVASIVAEAGGKASGHAGAVAAGEGAFNACGSPSLTSSYEGGLVTSGVNTPEKVRRVCGRGDTRKLLTPVAGVVSRRPLKA